ALALGHDLEAHGRLVDARIEPLQLAERLPLRLAHGLSGGLDPEVVAHLRAPPFFLRRTWRCCCGPRGVRGRGFAGGLPSSPPLSPPPVSAAGGVRELRRITGGAGVLGTRRRVMIPWPTVHRLVVTQ